jgi:hypothetical protein
MSLAIRDQGKFVHQVRPQTSLSKPHFLRPHNWIHCSLQVVIDQALSHISACIVHSLSYSLPLYCLFQADKGEQ